MQPVKLSGLEKSLCVTHIVNGRKFPHQLWAMGLIHTKYILYFIG